MTKIRGLILVTFLAPACGGSRFSADGSTNAAGAAGAELGSGGTARSAGTTSSGGDTERSAGTNAGGDAAVNVGGAMSGTHGGSPGVAGQSGNGSSGMLGTGGAAGATSSGGASTAGAAGNGGSMQGGAGGTTGTTPSCAGATGSECNGESCCSAITVPAGSFVLGGDVVTPTSAATVASFRLDKFEITVGRFRRFVSAYSGSPTAGSGAHPLIANSGWQAWWNASIPASAQALVAGLKSNCTSSFQTWTDTVGANETLPINCVTWYEAFAFCAWDGGRLPTEAEWEYAASGGKKTTFPWGETAPTTVLANYGCLGDGAAGCKFTDILPVGSANAGASPWGHQDLAGSMWEFVLDFSASYLATCNNCANVAAGGNRVQRGGSWRTTGDALRVADRTAATTTTGADSVGARCARD